MKTSTLQSMLMRNKSTIYYLEQEQLDIISSISFINTKIKETPENKDILEVYKKEEFQDLNRNKKKLKQLAKIQKEIKEEIKKNDKLAAINKAYIKIINELEGG